MGCALNQLAAGIQKLMLKPLQGNAPVRTAILIKMNNAVPAHGEDGEMVDEEPATFPVSQFMLIK